MADYNLTTRQLLSSTGTIIAAGVATGLGVDRFLNGDDLEIASDSPLDEEKFKESGEDFFDELRESDLSYNGENYLGIDYDFSDGLHELDLFWKSRGVGREDTDEQTDMLYSLIKSFGPNIDSGEVEYSISYLDKDIEADKIETEEDIPDLTEYTVDLRADADKSPKRKEVRDEAIEDSQSG